MRKKTPPVEKKQHLQFSKVATSKVKTAISHGQNEPLSHGIRQGRREKKKKKRETHAA